MKAKFAGGTVVSVVRDGDRYLLVRRKNAADHLSWVFPGGKVEPDETPRDASSREVREESGVLCKPAHMLGARIHPDTGAHIQYWLCDYISGDPFPAEPDKIVEARWMTAQELKSRITSDLYGGVLHIIDGLPESAQTGMRQ